jgi:hypothetical protein
MEIQYNPDVNRVAQARTLVGRAAKGVELMEEVVSQAFSRLAALRGMLARMEELTGSRDHEGLEAAALYAATVCRESMVLLHYLDSHQWASARVAANGTSRAGPPARLGSVVAYGG